MGVTSVSVAAQERSAASLLDDSLLAVGRLLLSIAFIFSGLGKIGRYAGTAALMQSHGVPKGLLPLVIVLEVGGGAALALGILTRVAAAALAVFSIAAIMIFLLPDPRTVTLRIVELAMIGGLFAYAARGGGRFSLERVWTRRR